MKKIAILFASLALLLVFSPVAKAALCIDPSLPGATVANFPQNGPGFVPCGQSPVTYDNSGKVTAGCPCELGHLFLMIDRIYNFFVWTLTFPIAAFMIILSGVLILLSGANPRLYEVGKKMLIYTLVGILLIFGSWLIIDILFKIIGYQLQWNSI
jgi:hypothetical protein